MSLTPKHGINSAIISINNDRVYIDGIHYRFAHGYLSRRSGQFAVNISDILSVGYIKGRAKLALMSIFLFGFLFLILDNMILDIAFMLFLPSLIQDVITFLPIAGFCVSLFIYLFIKRNLIEISIAGHRLCVKCRHYNKEDIKAFQTLIYQIKQQK